MSEKAENYMQGINLKEKINKHEALLQKIWWSYADANPEKALDGKHKEGRPPVVSRWSDNLILPSENEKSSEIKKLIKSSDRHVWFESFRSSQALAQSVFGAFKVTGKLDLLSEVTAECGRPAFGKMLPDTKLLMETSVGTLFNETGKKTQMDVLLASHLYKVVVECKFFELKFSTCSKTKNNKKNGEIECNGSYTRQKGRKRRCYYSEHKASYWKFIPKLFDWNANQDLIPCPFDETNQIVRNVLASVIGEDGKVNPSKGHTTFIYDNRNPVYKINGAAYIQFQKAAEACRVPGLMRRVSWQEIIRVCVGQSDFDWLLQELGKKHDIKPSIR